MPPAPAAPPAPPPALSASDFVRDLARSRVLDEGRAAALFGDAPPGRKWDPVAFADHLVDLGELTRFQADKVLRGHWHGLVLGPYRVLCPLGRGGMAVVYLARAAGGPVVALKVLPPLRARDEPRTLARFLREMATGRALPPHPNLVRTTDAGEWAGVHYLAMEYVPGKTVRHLVADGGPLAVGAAARVFADAAAGLSAAHAAGFVHRDLKPANVIVTPAGRAKVLDFGFALGLADPPGTDPAVHGGRGYTLGTMDYLPPEQAADASVVGPAADLYALGCSLYFAVTGCPPFPGGTPHDKIRWHRSADPPPVTQFTPSVPAEFARLIGWLMAKRPADRPASAQEARDHLEAWAAPIRPEPVAVTPAEALQQAEIQWRSLKTALPDVSPLPDAEPEPPAAPPESAEDVNGESATDRVYVPRWAIRAAGPLVAAAAVAVAVFGWLVGWLVAR